METQLKASAPPALDEDGSPMTSPQSLPAPHLSGVPETPAAVQDPVWAATVPPAPGPFWTEPVIDLWARHEVDQIHATVMLQDPAAPVNDDDHDPHAWAAEVLAEILAGTSLVQVEQEFRPSPKPRRVEHIEIDRDEVA